MSAREGSLEAPTRHALDWKNPEFYNEEKLLEEMERVFDVCHGCRRCVSLCESFPTLFDLVDESSTMEMDGVAKEDYWKVVDHCYLCDLCFLTKCPYVPPHEWNLDFPHLMLQAKAVRYQKEGASFRDKTLTSTDALGTFAGFPVISGVVNAMNRMPAFRGVLESTLGVHKEAVLPAFHSNKLRDRISNDAGDHAEEAGPTKGKVVLFATCYGNSNDPQTGEDLVSVFRHNGIAVRLADKEKCCGMPKLELGDLESVEQAKNVNIPELARLVDEGWDIVAPIPSCVLMFKQELPLMYPDDEQVKKVQEAMFDPFEYLMLRHKHGKLNTEFKNKLGNISYHVACHQRVQRIGMKTRDMLQLVPETEVNAIERCSGHDGTYAVKKEFHEHAVKIGRPVVNKVVQNKPDHFTSDCVMAGHHIADGVCKKEAGSEMAAEHPISLIRKAYGI